MGTAAPWKEDLLSKNEVLEREDVRVVAMAAIESITGFCDRRWGRRE